jgi:hypothetical protein
MHVAPLVAVLTTFQRDKIIRKNIDPESAARVLFAVSRNCFPLYFMIEDASISDLRQMPRRDLATEFLGYRPRPIVQPR